MASILDLKKAVLKVKREMVEDLVVDLGHRSDLFVPKETLAVGQLAQHYAKFDSIMNKCHQADGLIAEVEKGEADVAKLEAAAKV